MPYRPRDIYRGRRKFRLPLTICLFVLVFLIICAVALFYYLQRFLVYDQSGVSLELPFMQDETDVGTEEETEAEAEETAEQGPITVQVVYDDTDFSQVDLGGWEELSPTKVRYISFDDTTDAVQLANALTSVMEGNYTGAVLELKDQSGQLAWASSCDTAIAYGTSGTMDLTETVSSLHEQGLTVAAQISCCADELMATRNWTVTLQTEEGTAYQDEDGVYWLDPYNRTVRSYLSDLMQELAAMGFDEIILADLYHPVTDIELQYSTTLQTEANPITAVCQMGRTLVESLSDTDTVVSVLIDQDSLRNGDASSTGQDIEIFWHLFARIYCPTTADDAAADQALAVATMTQGVVDDRFVPVCGTIPDGFESYCIR